MNNYLRRYFNGINNHISINDIVNFNNQFNVDLHYDVFPAFFYGDLNISGPIVTISLNPQYSDETPHEQGADFNVWLDQCMDGFLNYPNDIAMHAIWKNLIKVIPGYTNRIQDKREFLQQHIINIDWCYYYSTNFPTLNNVDYHPLIADFSNNLHFLLCHLKPKLIFIHGKSLSSWFNNNCNNIVQELELQHGNLGSYNVFSGKLNNLNIPVVYQSWFINRANNNDNLERVRNLINNLI